MLAVTCNFGLDRLTPQDCPGIFFFPLPVPVRYTIPTEGFYYIEEYSLFYFFHSLYPVSLDSAISCYTRICPGYVVHLSFNLFFLFSFDIFYPSKSFFFTSQYSSFSRNFYACYYLSIWQQSPYNPKSSHYFYNYRNTHS